MASFFMQWHGPNGLTKIATKVRFFSQIFMEELTPLGIEFATNPNGYFDTVAIKVQESGFSSADAVLSEFHKFGINLRKIDNNTISLSFDELTNMYDLEQVIELLVSIKKRKFSKDRFMPFEVFEEKKYARVPAEIRRESKFLQQNQFAMKFSETNMMRYI